MDTLAKPGASRIGALVAGVLAATLLASAAAPAAAEDWHHGGGRGYEHGWRGHEGYRHDWHGYYRGWAPGWRAGAWRGGWCYYHPFDCGVGYPPPYAYGPQPYYYGN